MADSTRGDSRHLAWEDFPHQPDEPVIRLHFTLANDEIDALLRLPAPGAGLATAVAFAAVRWLGFIPRDLKQAPVAGVERLAWQLDVAISEIERYDPPERTARAHRRRAADLARFREPGRRDLDDLADFLADHALEHDSRFELLRTAALALHERRLLRPALSTLERIVASARMRAQRNLYTRLDPMLDAATRRALDSLCATDERLGISPLAWLRREAASATPEQIAGQLEKLEFLAGDARLAAIPANRRRELAALARDAAVASVARRPERLRYPALLCFCGDQAVRLGDEILKLADRAIREAHVQAVRDQRAARARASAGAREKVALLVRLIGLLLDGTIADDDLRARAWEIMSPGRWEAAREQAHAILRPLDDLHYAHLDRHYVSLRRFVPELLAALTFRGAQSAQPLIDAIDLLRELDAAGSRGLPDSAPTAFIPARWRGYVIGADGRLSRRRWELCLLSELRGALRSGAVWVEGRPGGEDVPRAYAWPARREAAYRGLGLSVPE